jgi:ribose 5-phosphate isomerase A
MSQADQKKRAAEAALEYVRDGAVIGVGTGSTVDFFIDALAQVKDRIEGTVSSSEISTKLLQAAGIPVLDLNRTGDLDIYVDGADEATKHLHLVKGGGGALTREKIIAAAARKFVCIIDESKLVGMLGAFPIPIEVIPMAQAYVARQLVKARGQPIWRKDFVTDNGNHIIDVHNLQIMNPVEMEERFNQIAGVVTVGLFARRSADVLLIGDSTGVRTIGV